MKQPILTEHEITILKDAVLIFGKDQAGWTKGIEIVKNCSYVQGVYGDYYLQVDIPSEKWWKSRTRIQVQLHEECELWDLVKKEIPKWDVKIKIYFRALKEARNKELVLASKAVNKNHV
jgi:hypothetical protein